MINYWQAMKIAQKELLGLPEEAKPEPWPRGFWSIVLWKNGSFDQLAMVNMITGQLNVTIEGQKFLNPKKLDPIRRN